MFAPSYTDVSSHLMMGVMVALLPSMERMTYQLLGQWDLLEGELVNSGGSTSHGEGGCEECALHYCVCGDGV